MAGQKKKIEIKCVPQLQVIQKLRLGQFKVTERNEHHEPRNAMNITRIDSSLSCREFADDHIERESNERYVEDL